MKRKSLLYLMLCAAVCLCFTPCAVLAQDSGMTPSADTKKKTPVKTDTKTPAKTEKDSVKTPAKTPAKTEKGSTKTPTKTDTKTSVKTPAKKTAGKPADKKKEEAEEEPWPKRIYEPWETPTDFAPTYDTPSVPRGEKPVPVEGDDGATPLRPPKPTAAQTREAKKFIADLKKEKDEKKKLEMIYAQQSVYAQEEALKYLQAEAVTAVRAYQKTFGDAAKKAVAKQMKERRDPKVLAKVERVKALQNTDFTGDQVREVIDPVIDEMLSVYWVEPLTITATDEKLAEARRELLEKTKLWNANVTMFSNMTHQYPLVAERPTIEEMLGLIEFDLVLASMPISPQGQKTLAMNRELAFMIDLQEAMCISYTNRYRILLGREPFLIDVAMCLACRDHSYDMARLGFFSHESQLPGKKSFGDRAKRFGVSGVSSENIFAGSSSGEGSAGAWFHSPGHHKNMMNGSKRVGVGRFNKHFTQMTGG